MKFATKKQLENARKKKKYVWIGWQLWTVFISLPPGNPIREYHKKFAASLTDDERERCERLD